jgi:carbonic anhydrase
MTMISANDSHSPSAADVLARLIEGNERFLRGKARNMTFCQETLANLATRQRPYATILGCSDSRVAPELIFDAGLGELFVIRVAGNVVSPEVMGSIQYAAANLDTPLFVVLGHEGCGAVHAALEALHQGVQYRARIARLLESIIPGVTDVSTELDSGEQLQHAVVANVRWAMHQILETPEAKVRAVEGRMMLVGAVYEIATGRVRILD